MGQSFRSRFRAFQAMRRDDVDAAFIADLEFVENRDLDLSIRLGAILGFNALLITIGTHPISASPGSPLSLDAGDHPVLTIASIIAFIPFIVSSYFCLRALLFGEEFDAAPMDEAEGRRQALFAAFIHSIDIQQRLLRRAIWASLTGGFLTIVVWASIIADKMLL